MKENFSKNVMDSSDSIQSTTNNQDTYRSCVPLRPILLIENLDKSFGNKKHKKTHNNISKEEEILLTLIANIIVEIIITEEL
ncbi:hypothetical protein [Pedobacter suwonensis]|uniref:hypothetical protein n=1 Tax=Pedobacter suwonensis TaxID=332999 RepID=UPI00368830AE